MTATVPSLADRLAEAELAYHRLRLGKAAVRVRMSDGSETQFEPTDENKLRGYVEELRDLVAGIDRRKHGAIGIIF